MNNWNGIGRLTKDVELAYSQNGVAIGTFTLAVNRQFKNEQGEYDADFIRVKAFKKTAEILAEYVKKGQQIGISGRIQTGSYEKDGQRVFTMDVIVNDFTFVSAPKSPNNNATSNNNQSDTNHQDAAQNLYKEPNNNLGTKLDINDSDLPF